MKSFAIAAIVPLVAGHGYITTPPGRVVGSAMSAACGAQIANNQGSDNAGNIQGEMQLIQSDFNAAECNLWLCKGYQFADNSANIQSYTAGQVVDMVYDIRAPHTGYANVSIVDTATNSVIGEPLIKWDVFASTGTGVTDAERNFQVTIPDLGGKCATAGECVIQHFWHSDEAAQTYEACVDFAIAGGSSGGNPVTSAPPASSSAAAVTSAASSAAPTTLATVTTPPAATSTPVTGCSASKKKRNANKKRSNRARQ